MPTLGSLFDGIGGFPLAALRNGITPLWASEIAAFPSAVTQIHFPELLQVGDITKLDGAKLPPVDVITGGSPCQDLSVAGRRAGLAGERSGLFMEQIRVTKELRDADRKRGRTAGAVRPRYFVWENVPGAFSSGEPPGEDFRVVLEEICRLKDCACAVPRPDAGTWEPAGGIILDDQFSLAWRVLDAQFWGVPQRRKRIYLVADFGGRAAPQILFEQDRLFGHSAPCRSAGQRAAASPGSSIEMAGGSDGNHIVFATNQRDEVRDLHDVAGALQAEPGMKQQTFIADCLTPWDTQQKRIFTPESTAPTLAGVDGGGRNPGGLVFVAGVVSKDGGDGSLSPPLPDPTPAVLCLNDQGGQRMDLSENKSGTLRAGMDGHPPLVMENRQDGGQQPLLFENHGIDSRYTGPHAVAPTLSARCGTGGNNMPLVGQEPDSYCIAGNAIDRQARHGGHGLGCQPGLSYTLTGADRHAVYSRQRSDEFQGSDVTATQTSRQHKDATDLVIRPCQETVGTLVRDDHKGISNQYVSADKCIVEEAKLIRRLTPLECERLQGYPDGWTDIPNASDSARYKALGNSVAIPCVEFVLRGIFGALHGCGGE